MAGGGGPSIEWAAIGSTDARVVGVVGVVDIVDGPLAAVNFVQEQPVTGASRRAALARHAAQGRRPASHSDTPAANVACAARTPSPLRSRCKSAKPPGDSAARRTMLCAAGPPLRRPAAARLHLFFARQRPPLPPCFMALGQNRSRLRADPPCHHMRAGTSQHPLSVGPVGEPTHCAPASLLQSRVRCGQFPSLGAILQNTMPCRPPPAAPPSASAIATGGAVVAVDRRVARGTGHGWIDSSTPLCKRWPWCDARPAASALRPRLHKSAQKNQRRPHRLLA